MSSCRSTLQSHSNSDRSSVPDRFLQVTDLLVVWLHGLKAGLRPKTQPSLLLLPKLKLRLQETRRVVYHPKRRHGQVPPQYRERPLELESSPPRSVKDLELAGRPNTSNVSQERSLK